MPSKITLTFIIISSSLATGWTQTATTNSEPSSFSTLQSYKGSLKDNYYYFGFNASFGISPFQTQLTNPTVSFGYTYNNTPGEFTYHGTKQWTTQSTSALYGSGGLEIGLSNSVFIYTSINGFHIHGNAGAFETELGYNINLPSKRWTLRPSIGYSAISTSIPFSQTIDNVQKDAVIFGNVYPYKYQGRNSSHGSMHTKYNDNIQVGMIDRALGVKLQLGIRKNFSLSTAIQLNVGYRYYPYNKFNLYAKSGAGSNDISVNSQGLAFNNGDNLKNEFNFQGFYSDIMLSCKLNQISLKHLPKCNE